MTMAVIQTDSLGKEYRRDLGGPSGLLRDTLARALRSPASLFRGERTEKFWALPDASLEVKEGEVLGLNGNVKRMITLNQVHASIRQFRVVRIGFGLKLS
jgi:ABC-type polysaccharide/polyol phosphate transport system ATPase subunit